MSSIEDRRKFRRKYMLFKIPAYDAKTRRFLGLVQDVSDEGVQLFGVKVEVGEVRGIVIQASDYLKTPPLHFQAECRWTSRQDPLGYHLSGFRITAISHEARQNLARLIEFVSLG